MNEIIKKIDEMKLSASRLIVKKPCDRLDEIQNDISEGYITACDEIKDYIQSEHKKPCEQCNYKTNNLYCDGRCEEGKMKTNFDVITESPEKLAELLRQDEWCVACVGGRNNIKCTDITCEEGMLQWLNQKAEEE